MLPSPELLHTLSPKALRALVATFGPVAGLRANATPFEIARALFALPPPSASASPASASKKLATIVSSTLPRFGTRAARLAFVEALRALGDKRADAWLALPPADVAANLLVEQATTKGRARKLATRVLALATHRVERDLPERPTYELVAESAPVERDAKRVVARLRRALGDQLVTEWSALDPDGTLRLALFLRQPDEMRLVVDASAREGIAQRHDVPVAVDCVRILPDGDRVTLTTATPELLPTYAAALGLSLRPSFTLRPLAKLTAARLAALRVAGVTRVEVVGARLRRPDGFREELRGPDVLPPLTRTARAGYVDRATIRATLDGATKVDAFLQLPHRLDVSDRAFEVPVRAMLAALGIFTPGALPDDARSLAPYQHGEWRWCAVLGNAHFERMKAQARFTRVASAHVASEEYRMHGAAYSIREVPGEADTHYALAEDRSLGARLVSAADRVAWQLDCEALRAAMARDLDATRADAALAIEGVLDLGIVSLASGKLRFVYAMGEPPAGWLDAVRRACGLGMTPVAFVPRGHAGEPGGIVTIELELEEQLGAKGVGRALGRAAEALGVAGEVAAWRVCEEELVLVAATKSVWVLGVRVMLNERLFGLLAHLAVDVTIAHATKDLGGLLAKGSSTPDVAARKAKSEVERQVRAALEAAGVDAEIVERLIVAEGRKGYRLGVTARVV
jgi:hypothetical protein